MTHARGRAPMSYKWLNTTARPPPPHRCARLEIRSCVHKHFSDFVPTTARVEDGSSPPAKDALPCCRGYSLQKSLVRFIRKKFTPKRVASWTNVVGRHKESSKRLRLLLLFILCGENPKSSSGSSWRPHSPPTPPHYHWVCTPLQQLSVEFANGRKHRLT